MKYFTAVVSSIFMFFVMWFLLGLFFIAFMPRCWSEVEVECALLSGNVPSLLAAILAGLGAVYTFKASLKAKTGRLYRKKKANEVTITSDDNNQEKSDSEVVDE